MTHKQSEPGAPRLSHNIIATGWAQPLSVTEGWSWSWWWWNSTAALPE